MMPRSVKLYSVYTITDADGGVYVGCTEDPVARWRCHCSHAASPKPVNKRPITAAIRERGKDAFVFTVVAQSRTRKHALDTECDVMRQFRRQGARLCNVAKPTRHARLDSRERILHLMAGAR